MLFLDDSLFTRQTHESVHVFDVVNSVLTLGPSPVETVITARVPGPITARRDRPDHAMWAITSARAAPDAADLPWPCS